ncbi:MFS transporter [Nocardia bovistercoris]|uniref:MFS transporter n=1 Tax=Nocardia bovistercoris TaxID=2785916 RepID=A0A931N686_9NOCA|nr:MFS transporter [Nocardia bovistercoris]MBH0780231.1 MFS transporter [Nocardia bovistercoris]
MTTARSFLSFPPSVRLLLVNQLAGNTGFYLLIPFLADYLLTDLGLSAAVVGTVLGVRNLSQQGLFLVGGSAADRLGARGVIVIGAGVRAAGFALFAVGGSVPIVLLASILTGFAGALFNPAVRAYIARDSEDRAAEAFALFTVFGNVGSALGPVLGTALAAAGFRITALVAAGIFGALTLAQLVLLPARPAPPHATGVFGDFARVFTHRAFWAFAFALMGMFALQSQIYFLFTMQAERAAGSAGAAAVAALFVAETAVILLFQVRITRLFAARPTRGPAMATGMAVMGASFVLPPAAATLIESEAAPRAVRVAPVVLAAIGLAVGVMITQPFVNELIPRFAGTRLTGTYFGAFYLASGIFTVTMTTCGGALVDRGGSPLSWPPALLCAATGLLSAAAVSALHRSGLLPEGGAAATSSPKDTSAPPVPGLGASAAAVPSSDASVGGVAASDASAGEVEVRDVAAEAIGEVRRGTRR